MEPAPPATPPAEDADVPCRRVLRPESPARHKRTTARPPKRRGVPRVRTLRANGLGRVPCRAAGADPASTGRSPATRERRRRTPLLRRRPPTLATTVGTTGRTHPGTPAPKPNRFESCRARQPLQALFSNEKDLVPWVLRLAVLLVVAAPHRVRHGQKPPQDALSGLGAHPKPAIEVRSTKMPCSASTTFAGRVASFEDVTRHPQNDRTRCLGRFASRRHRRAEIRPPGGSPWTGSTPQRVACSGPESGSRPRLVNRRRRPGCRRSRRASRP